jgi:serine/threonine protein kinase
MCSQLDLCEARGNLLVAKTYDLEMVRKQGLDYQLFVEVAVLRRVKHPGLPRFHSSFTQRGTLTIVMEFLPGGDLLSFQKASGGTVSPSAARLVVAEMLLVLH